MGRDIVGDDKAVESAEEAAEVGSPALVLGGNANNAARAFVKTNEITNGSILVPSMPSLVIFHLLNKGGENNGQ